MMIQKFRWSKVYESSEEELKQLLQARRIEAQCITGMAESQQLQLVSDKESTLWCAEGSLMVRTENTTTPLQAGDGLRLVAGTTYDVHAGIAGYVYYVSEA